MNLLVDRDIGGYNENTLLIAECYLTHRISTYTVEQTYKEN